VGCCIDGLPHILALGKLQSETKHTKYTCTTPPVDCSNRWDSGR
jgi:hypothetical protein